MTSFFLGLAAVQVLKKPGRAPSLLPPWAAPAGWNGGAAGRAHDSRATCGGGGIQSKIRIGGTGPARFRRSQSLAARRAGSIRPSATGGELHGQGPRVGHLAGAAGWPWGEGACMMCMHAASVRGQSLVEVELLFRLEPAALRLRSDCSRGYPLPRHRPD